MAALATVSLNPLRAKLVDSACSAKPKSLAARWVMKPYAARFRVIADHS